MSDADSYDDYDFSEYSQDDLNRIDGDIAETLAEKPQALSRERGCGSPNGGPTIEVTVEESSDGSLTSSLAAPAALQDLLKDSPYSLHRSWKNALSVTDLTSPLW
jgi:hypothetical protein